MDKLERVAQSAFGLEVVARLQVSEHFSSAVLSFVATDDRHYVLKRHWARNKAEREAAALQALDSHPDVPALLATSESEDVVYLLIEGLDGAPWANVAQAPPGLLRKLGRSVGLLHRTPADSFDGLSSWHGLLTSNADRYVAAIGPDDSALAEQARVLLEGHIAEVPSSNTPCLVHFDLRPGNILVHRDHLIGIIDFEACRGGHGSMDLFKLWQQVAPHVTGGLTNILQGYLDTSEAAEAWTDPSSLDRLMQVYAVYHGLAGLSWCYARNDFTGDFPDMNRSLIHTATAALG